MLSAIVLAAGKGSRLRSRVPKPLIEISGKPLVIHCLAVLESCPLIKEIIVVANKGNLNKIAVVIKKFGISKVKKIVKGGLRRQDSVLRGLKALNPEADLVLIHDGARPFIDKKLVARVTGAARKYKAAIPAVPVKATIKEVVSRKSLVVRKTLKRDELWEAQTPQVFERDLIFKAYKKYNRGDFTDDASLVEKSGVPVKVVEGSYRNIKITTPEDLKFAQANIAYAV